MEAKVIGVAGLGLLGRGISACLLGHGFRVVAFTRRPATHEVARDYIAQAIGDLVDRADFSPDLIHEWPERYEPVDSFDRFERCEFVIESIVEDMGAKQAVFDVLESVVAENVPIASNTSALPISTLQADRNHPARFLGMHWAEPAHATRFLELIRGDQTSDMAMEEAIKLATALGKDPSLVQQDVPGFIVNRIGYAMYREAMHIVESGIADVETVDRSCRNALGLWATICGPFRWIDLTGGPALYAKAMEGVMPTLSNRTDVPPMMNDRNDAHGVEDGDGFYQYTEEEALAWKALFRDHAWTVRKLVDRYFPQDDP